MQLVERHIRINDSELEAICGKAKNLYNQALYYLRQATFGNIEKFSEYELSGLFAEFKEENYKELPAQTSQQIIKNLQKISIKIKIKPQISVQNMVASGNIKMDLNLNELALKLENTEYEPEQFPGLVFKLKGTHATFLLFSNGKIVCTGTKSEVKLREAVALLVKVLKNVK